VVERVIHLLVELGERPPAPAFVLPMLDGGGSVELASLRGSPVVVNFWASWCEPCKAEAGLLRAASERYGPDGVAFLGIVMGDDFPGDAREFVARYGIPYQNVRDEEKKVAGRYGLTGVPETYFVDAEGRLVGAVKGELDAVELDNGIRLAAGG
jgi:cytochrome c biogenesis protein CcmG/thiol:disulfide interchange protein DsbE